MTFNNFIIQHFNLFLTIAFGINVYCIFCNAGISESPINKPFFFPTDFWASWKWEISPLDGKTLGLLLTLKQQHHTDLTIINWGASAWDN